MFFGKAYTKLVYKNYYKSRVVKTNLVTYHLGDYYDKHVACGWEKQKFINYFY